MGIAVGAAVAGLLIGFMFARFGWDAIKHAVESLPSLVRRAAKPILTVILTVGVVAVLVWQGKEGNHPKTWAEIIAAVVLAALTLLCWLARRKDWVVKKDGKFEHAEDNTTIEYVPHQRLTKRELEKLNDEEKENLEVGRQPYLRSLYVGADGRWSTSKTQALLWTYVVLFGLIALFAADYFGLDLSGAAEKDAPGEQGFSDIELRPEYLLFLGGPFAAAILARGLVASKLEKGEVVKPNEDPDRSAVTGLRDLISNDAGNADLIDFQYLCFNLVAIAVVLFQLVPNLQNGFPEVPEFLVGLTSASALAYVTKKAVERSRPSIARLVPSSIFRGETLTIQGRYLVAPPNRKPSVKVDGRKANVTSVATGVGGDEATVTVKVPVSASTGTDKRVSVFPEGASAPAESTALEIVESNVEEVSPEKIVVRPGAQVVIKGSGFGPEQGKNGEVKLGRMSLVVRGVGTWSNKQIVAFVPDINHRDPTPTPTELALVVTGDDGRSSALKMVPVEGVRIDAVDPLPVPGAKDGEFTITGANFGAVVGPKSGVDLEGQKLHPLRWSDTLIVARLDKDAADKPKQQLRVTSALKLTAVTPVDVEK
jgi:MFS family permease